MPRNESQACLELAAPLRKVLESKRQARKRLAELPFAPKLVLLEKLRDRSLRIAASPLRRHYQRQHGCQRLKSPLECVVMTTVALTAHFDGEKVQFDEPCRLDANARLMVVVLPPDDERHAWSRLSAGQLARAYGDTEPEYTAAGLRP